MNIDDEPANFVAAELKPVESVGLVNVKMVLLRVVSEEFALSVDVSLDVHFLILVFKFTPIPLVERISELVIRLTNKIKVAVWSFLGNHLLLLSHQILLVHQRLLLLQLLAFFLLILQVCLSLV